ncbi:MAG TPA: hypothetical protein VFZ25_03010 [Chloroflexota bacterium]|nr:hypothetical protein [Chloroflexota bacterium]
MDERARLDPSYFSVPASDWSQVEPTVAEDLERLHRELGQALRALGRASIAPSNEAGEQASALSPPAELALRMHETAGSLLGQVAADEQGLRQVITTLRTAFAVAWDLYSFKESERVTVAEHMRQLRDRIEEFERELLEIQKAKGSASA